MAGALGAQLRPKRGRSASRGLLEQLGGPVPRPARAAAALPRSAANGAAPQSTEPRSRGEPEPESRILESRKAAQTVGFWLP